MSPFQRVKVMVERELDQTAAQVRTEYFRLDKDRRRVFREWVEKLVQAGEPPVSQTGWSIGAKVQMRVQGLQEMENVPVSPRILAKALAAWDAGEEYIGSIADF